MRSSPAGFENLPKEYHGQLSKDYGNHWNRLQDHLEEVRDDLGLESMYLLPEAEEEIGQTLKAIGFTKRTQEIKDVEKK